MSTVMINTEDLKFCIESLKFLKNINPRMQEKLKTIIWWESLKEDEKPKGNKPPENKTA